VLMVVCAIIPALSSTRIVVSAIHNRPMAQPEVLVLSICLPLSKEVVRKQ
jgi:hypothetical protein